MNNRLELLSVLSRYPLLIPTNCYKIWEGYVCVKGEHFKTVIQVPNFPSTNEISWKFHPQIELELKNQRNQLVANKTLLEFLCSVQSIIENKFSSFQASVPWSEQDVLLHKQLIMDLEKSLNSCYIEGIGEDFQWIRVVYMDSKYYRHTISLGLKSSEQKTHFKIIQHDLPIDAVSVLSQMSTFSELFPKLEETVELLIPFWELCSQVDGKCWIIDPSNPKKGDTHRRIYLAEDLSVMLRFNPFDVTSLPDVKFLGSINAVKEARENFQNGLEIYDGWDNELNVLENLERLLEIKQFMTKRDVEQKRCKAGNSSDCLICYETHTEQPVKYCLNEKCTALFHLTCILKWFQTSQACTVAPHYDYTRGPCPCCETLMYCPRASVLFNSASAV